MSHHSKTLRLLTNTKSRQEKECRDLTSKINDLDDAIKLWKKARRVLDRKKQRIIASNTHLAARIRYEMQRFGKEKTEKR